MIGKRIELTEVQKGIYFDCQVDNPIAYNISASILLENVNERDFEHALKLLVAEQEALRSTIELIDDLPVLAIHDVMDVVLNKMDLTHYSDNKEEQLELLLQQEIGTPFDLAIGPLSRLYLVKLYHNKYLFVIIFHHIISDGLSLEIFKTKLLDYYDRLVNKTNIVLKQDSGFSHFIEQENEKLKKGEYTKQKEYWLNKMQGAQPLGLQADYSVKQKDNGMGREKRFPLQKDLMEKIQHVASDQEVTVYMYFLAIFSVLMNRYTHNRDVVFSAPFSYRPNFDMEETVGCFVHMLPMRFQIENHENFSSILQQSSKELIDVYKHIGYPNNLIMRDSGIVPMPGLPSLFDVSFVYDVYEDHEENSLKSEIVDQDMVTFAGNLMFILNKTPKGDVLKIQYKPGMFSDETIEMFGLRMIKLLEVTVSNVDIKVQDIDLMLENERHTILNEFNTTTYFSYEPQTIIDVFHSKVSKHPSRIALISHERTETYASVNAKANVLARKIIEKKKSVNEAIGVQLERSPDLVITLLAILKAGCAYVPIDAAYPKARKDFICEDANISLIITSRHLLCEIGGDVEFLCVDDHDTYTGNEYDLLEKQDPFSLAYIIYTSGSTGKPKGVMVKNHSVVNTLLDLDRRFPVEEQDVYMLKTPFTFDVSATELFGWFMGEGALLILEKNGEKNPQLILDEIEKHSVTHINFVPSMFRLFLELFDLDDHVAKLNSLKWIFVGGEAVTPDILQKFNSLGTHISLENVYGPTECTIWASTYSLKDIPENANIPIGEPLNETRWYVVGEHNELQPIGITGELCLSGVGLARGYLNRDDLTKEKFILNPFFQEGVDPEHFRYMYRTGDLVRWLPSGTIEFLGRIDFQVKIRGVRLEVGEIENALSEYEDIVQAVVVVKKEENKHAVLCAYYRAEAEIPETKLKDYLSSKLPSYMIPSYFVYKKELPLNSSDKIDRNALIADKEYLKNRSTSYSVPKTDLEKIIASLWKEVLSVDRVGLDDNFFEIGGTSLSLIGVHNKLRKMLKRDFSITLLFQSPTVRLLAEQFSKEEKEAISNRKQYFKRSEKIVLQDIAIVGMSVNVPGAENVHEFWGNLKTGKESIYFYSDDELRNLGVSPNLISSPNYIKAKGRVEGIEYFDPKFFEYTPAEVSMMSPQLRLLYSAAWEALEDAGYYPGSTTSKMGIFLGGSDDFEWYRKLLYEDDSYSDQYQVFTLSTNHFLASRLAYKLDIKGPVFSALTGCSTTLVTPHLACQSLTLGECDMAIAGGITVELPNEGGYLYEEGMMFSPDGHCRPFDAKAKGTVFSNGLGLVVLKRLDEALQDGDHIYAVIKGSAINNDGNQKVGFVAPSVEGQAEVISEAYRRAGIDPETVSYVEAHGTGTALGDPIEVQSLTKAFGTDKKQFCVLGSVKGNVGHADTAAGVVGLAKVALSLKNKYIPGTVNYEEPNPKIRFEDTPFTVTSQGMEWKNRGVLRAGINSFGVGGTNAHMVLEEPPIIRESSPADGVNLLVFSGKSQNALTETAENVVEYLMAESEINLSDVAWTLQIGRKAFSYRKAIVINEKFYENRESAYKKLKDAAIYEVNRENRNVYFMFPGQGSQYQGMGRDLYLSRDRSRISNIFKRYMNEVFDMLPEEERKEFLEIMYGEQNPEKINRTEYSQFAIFATSYALAKTLMEIGITPAGLIGHSIGEVAAAAVTGVFQLKDAVELVRIRGSVMQKQELGVMLAVMTDSRNVAQELEEGVWLSLENTTNSCVVGGTEEAISRFQNKCNKLGWKYIRVKTSHAFHTPMMENAAEEFKEKISNYPMNEPAIPIVSNESGTWVREGQMTNPQYWCDHILKPVLFSDSLSELLQGGEDVFIEVGAGRTLSTFARQHTDKKSGQQFVNLIRHPQEVENDVEYLNSKLGQIWCSGIEIDWSTLKGDYIRNRISLPTYAFDKMHFPIHLVEEAKKEKVVSRSMNTVESILHHEKKSISLENYDELEHAVIEAYNAVFGFDTIKADQDFFELGGDSLKAVSLSSALKNELGIKVDIADLFQYPSPGALTRYLKENCVMHETSFGIKPAEIRDYYPLSSAQSRMYALYLLDRKNTAYNLPSVTIIHGRLDRDRVEETLEKLINRHESLRTSFEMRENQPVQIIHPTVSVPIQYVEKAVESDEEIQTLVEQFVEPFQLEKAPLFRVLLVKTDHDRYLLLLDFHHIIADGTSVEIITRDFNELYFDNDLTPTKIQYKDFALWQNDYLKSEEIEKQRKYWVNQLDDELPVLDLPTDFVRPSLKNFEGDRIYFSLNKDLADKLTTFSHKSGTTLYMTLLSAWNVLLARYSNQEEIIVGTPVAGRTQEGIQETVGMFVNMLAMRNRPENQKRFRDFLHEVKENTLMAFQNQDYQFDELVEVLNLKRELNRNALFDVCFDFQNMEFYDLKIEGMTFSPFQMETKTASYDLVLTCQENKKEQTIEGFLEYSTSLFKEETIQRMVQHFQKILAVIIEEKDMTIEEIDLLTEEEKQWIMENVNSTTLPYDESLTIVDMFQRNVRNHPDKTALILSNRKALSYRELNEKSNVLAWHLLDSGLEKGSLVGIMCDRDERLFVSLLGVLKAGCAYVPIDPAFPKERISYMLSECEVSALILPQDYRGSVDFDGTIIDFHVFESDNYHRENPPQRESKDSLACVIFTSGSTGKPKGVMINGSSIVNFIHDVKNREIFQHENDRVLCVTTLSFDIFGFESIVPLCTGHSVYLADETEVLDPAIVSQKIVEHKVTHILSTVSRIQVFIENPYFDRALKELKCILSGGENYPISMLMELQEKSQAKIYNMYGPTETTIWSTTKDLTHARSINIGQPIANTRAYITNGAGKLQPIGVYGELCLGGKGLSRGYYNRPQETNEKFVMLPDSQDGVLYKTGDKARLLPNGEIELAGRLDSQIKIRGYRMESNEIEQVVLEHENIRQAVITVCDDSQNNKQLALYYSTKRETAYRDHAWLKNWLKNRLPSYMIPTRFIRVEEMPILPNGKINKKALPAPVETSDKTSVDLITPSTKLELELVEIWKEVLNLEYVSVRDNFFDVGGNSLGLIRVNNKLDTLLGRSVPLMQLFEHPTIESLVKSLDIPNMIPDVETHHDDTSEKVSEDIAIIGMACKFPGADNLDVFWENLVSGKESITVFSDEELLKSGIDKETLSHPNYVKAKGYLEGVEYFDSAFFDYPYQESNMMDPQIRLMHQCVWEALENAGYDSSSYEGKIGLFAGSGSHMPWMTKFLGSQHDLINAFEAMTLNEKDFLTTRISYKLNLKGPSFNVQTACSTSLVAIHQAAQSLLRGESDMAIAGGVSISYPRREGYMWHEGMIFSKDGHCRPFSDDASGTVSGNGCGIVVLKPLSAAVRDGDHIYGVMKGSAINNDGLEKVGYTAPSISGQTDVIENALNRAGVSPEQIHYLEAHGTGTVLGDPVEIQALKQAWKTDKKGYCAIGSVKANIGHCDAAAGVAGFIKSVLTLYHRTIPPHINYRQPNPRIDIENSPFYINTKPVDLTDHDEILRVGVSSFGIGGTNVHVILEEHSMAPKPRNKATEEVNLLLFSARSQTSLAKNSETLLSYLQSHPDVNLSDAAWTLQAGRKAFQYRKALTVYGTGIHQGSNIPKFMKSTGTKIPDTKRSVIFIFPDDGPYKRMGRDFYANRSRISEIFRNHLDQVLSFLRKEEREQLLNENDGKINPSLHRITTFAVGYSLSKTLMELGIMPNGLMGEGVGEITSLALGGALNLRDAVDAVKTSSSLSQYQQDRPRIPVIATSSLSKDGNGFFIEIGDGRLMTKLILQDLSQGSTSEFVSLFPQERQKSTVYLMEALGKIWCEGIDIDWNVLKGDGIRKRIPLPTYVFDKKYHDHDVNVNSLNLTRRDGNVTDREPDEKAIPKEDTLDITRELSRIWQNILGCEEVQPHDDFFALGGHSLKAISLTAEIQKELGVEMPLTEIFNTSVFSRMAGWISSRTDADQQEGDSIQPVKVQPYYEVSSAQKRMYAVHEMIEDAVPYNLGAVYLVEGSIDKEKFKRVIDELVRRHESFRTRFSMVNGEVVQIIEESVPSVVKFEDASENEIEEKIEKFITPFDLSQASLLRIKLISLGEEKHVLLIDIHHIISDQSSIAILLEEIQALYSGAALPLLKIQYKDFAAWQNQYFRSKEMEKQIQYWKNEFSGEIPKLHMLTDYHRPSLLTYHGDTVHFELDEALSARLNQYVKDTGVTPYMVLIAALKLVLWKYTGQNDLVVGTGIAGRRHADLNSVVGMFVNTLAIRSQIHETLTLSEYLQSIKDKMVNAYENQDCQYEMLIETLGIEKDLSRNPLFDVLINYINMGTEELALEGLSLKPWPVKEIFTKFDLSWTIVHKDNRYYADIEYNTSLFKRESMEAFGNRLLYMLSLIVGEPTRKLNQLSIVTPEEEQWLLHDCNDSETDFPGNSNIAELFEECVEQYGLRPAIIWGEEQLSYYELNQKANRVAELISQYGIQRGDKIAILLDRSPVQVISIWGILKSGCTYVPIDPDYPEERILFMLKDSGSCLLLTSTLLVSRVEHTVPSILLDEENLEMVSNPSISQSNKLSFDDTAYIIYTSGSTGTPKGTLVSHRNVIRVVRDTNYIEILPEDRFLQLSNYAFDASVFHIFGALLNGASLVMISKEEAIEVSGLSKFIEQSGVTAFFITSSLFNMIVDHDVSCLKNTRKILIGGEALSVTHIRKALEYLGPDRLINGYGPTETTVFAAYYPINELEEDAQSVPIGYPISNTKLYILDKQGQLVPPNVLGELYIGGAGVSKGYLNREELTEEKFLSDPIENIGRVYRTGDLVWRMPTGEIGYLGRSDFQIKLRGFRVELGEIENSMKKIPGVMDVIVLSQKDRSGSLYIAAYYTTDGEVQPNDIRKYLKKQMPDYMIPSRMKKMKSLPLNLNGKIDRLALPVIEEESELSSQDAPRNQVEKILLQTMREVLDHHSLGIQDDFFQFGGHSIKAIAFVQSLSKIGISLKVNEVFQYRTVEKLASLPKLKDLYKQEPVVSVMEKTTNAINLNEKQIVSLTDHVMSNCSMISKTMVSGNIISQFPLSPVQIAHAAMGSNLSGFTTEIKGNLGQSLLQKVLVKIIQNNQLLHCVIREEETPMWKEFDHSTLIPFIEKNIPYLDLRDYTERTKGQIVEKLCSYLLSSPYEKGHLPWRLCTLRCDDDTHFIIWGFDHTAFDGMSGEVIRHQIEKIVSFYTSEIENGRIQIHNLELPQKYQDYVSLLEKGPQNITEREIIDLFSLHQWSENNTVLMERLEKTSNTSETEMEIEIPLAEKNDPWWVAFDFMVELLKECSGLEQIPLAIVNYGRSYNNQDFYHCVGEFLDIIPLLVNESEEEERIPGLLKEGRNHSINFLSLLYDESLSKKFPTIDELLTPSYKNSRQKNFVLFNFQGYVSNEEKEAFKNSLEESQENNLGKLLITAHYDEDHITISFNDWKGLDTEKMTLFIESHGKKYGNLSVNVNHYTSSVEM